MTSLLAAEAGTAAVSFPVLTAMVLTPFLGAIFLLVLPNNRPE